MTLKLRLRGESYDIIEAVSDASMQNLKVLNVASAQSGGSNFPPVTPRTIQECFQLLGEKSTIAGYNQIELLDDPAFLANIQGVVFLARRKRGEQVTFDEAGDFAFKEISFVNEEDSEPEIPKDQSAPE